MVESDDGMSANVVAAHRTIIEPPYGSRKYEIVHLYFLIVLWPAIQDDPAMTIWDGTLYMFFVQNRMHMKQKEVLRDNIIKSVERIRTARMN